MYVVIKKGIKCYILHVCGKIGNGRGPKAFAGFGLQKWSFKD